MVGAPTRHTRPGRVAEQGPLPKRQFDQRSSINNEQCPEAECPEDFAHFAQKRFMLGILRPIRVDGKKVSKRDEKHGGRKYEDAFKIFHAEVLRRLDGIFEVR